MTELPYVYAGPAAERALRRAAETLAALLLSEIERQIDGRRSSDVDVIFDLAAAFEHAAREVADTGWRKGPRTLYGADVLEEAARFSDTVGVLLGHGDRADGLRDIARAAERLRDTLAKYEHPVNARDTVEYVRGKHASRVVLTSTEVTQTVRDEGEEPALV